MINYLTFENHIINKFLILSIITMSIFLSFQFGFGEYHNKVDYSSYYNPFPPFKISYPSDWRILYSTPVEVSFGLPNELVYAKVSIKPTNLSLTEYSQDMIEKITEIVRSKVFPSQNNISISDYPGYQVTGIWLDNPLNIPMDVVETWTVNDGTAYRISFYSPRIESDYAYYPPIIDSVIENMTKSFRLID